MISRFKCIECGREYSLDEIRFKCDCGDLLEVVSDLASFGRTGDDWRREFESGKDRIAFARYKDMLLPDLPDGEIVTLLEGDTPLYRAGDRIREHIDVDELYLKHEGMNPTLSFKDRGMVAGVSWAKHLGVRRVACASTGDTSAALAAYAARAGLQCIVLLPKGKISLEQLSQAISFGAVVLQLETDFDGCMRVVKEVTERCGVYLLNSMNSVRIEGQKAIAIEALHQLDWDVPDFVVVPVGNAGNISAVGKGIRELYELGVIDRKPRLVGVEAEHANPVYVSYVDGFSELKPITAKKTVASAMQIGDPVSFKKAVRELRYFDGLMEQASETEIMDAKAIIDRSGVPACPNSAAAVAGLRKLRDKDVVTKSDKVVVVLSAHGSKFSGAANDYYLDEQSEFSNLPVTVEPTADAVEEALAAHPSAGRSREGH
ncbi:MAG: threonine synthase [Planctomycetota bacterium]